MPNEYKVVLISFGIMCYLVLKIVKVLFPLATSLREVVRDTRVQAEQAGDKLNILHEKLNTMTIALSIADLKARDKRDSCVDPDCKEGFNQVIRAINNF